MSKARYKIDAYMEGQKEVEGTLVGKCLGVRKDGKVWSLDHIASGKRVAVFGRKADAMLVGKVIDAKVSDYDLCNIDRVVPGIQKDPDFYAWFMEARGYGRMGQKPKPWSAPSTRTPIVVKAPKKPEPKRDRNFSVEHYRALDHWTRDWGKFGWENTNMSSTVMSWKKGDRKIEIFPNQVYTQFGPLEVRVDGLAYKKRFYDVPSHALEVLRPVLMGQEGPKKGALAKPKKVRPRQTRRRPQTIAEAKSYLKRRGWTQVEYIGDVVRIAQNAWDDFDKPGFKEKFERELKKQPNARVRKDGSKWMLLVAGKQVGLYTSKKSAMMLADALNDMTLAQAKKEVGLA